VPDKIGFRTKPQLAIDLIRRAVAGSVPFGWIVADEVYGRAGSASWVVRMAALGHQ
jgi:SRSO17 transposase